MASALLRGWIGWLAGGDLLVLAVMIYLATRLSRGQTPGRGWLPSRFRRVSPAALTVAAGAVLGIIAGVIIAFHSPRSAASGSFSGDAVWPARTRPAPSFSLRDQTGRAVSLGEQRGHLVLLTFMDSKCQNACTIEGGMLDQLMGRLGGSVHPVLMIVSVNPADTPATVHEFMARTGFAPTWPWHWLVGSETQLRPVWQAYGLEVKVLEPGVIHSSDIYLIDQRGDERAGFAYPFPLKPVAVDLQELATTQTVKATS